MNRTLPKYEIEGIDFIVDVDFNLLRHPTENKIGYSFLHDMTETGTGYTLIIDPKSMLSDTQTELQGKQVIYEIPYMVKLDPEGMKEKFSTLILPETDSELKSNEDLLYRRSIGKPAAVDILDDYFFVSAEQDHFIAPGAGSKFCLLDTRKMSMDNFITVHQCLYDPTAKAVYRPEDNTVPEGIIGLEIPSIAYCDSYNYARLHNRLEEPDFFRWHPVRANMKAREIAVEKLGYTRKSQQKSAVQDQGYVVRTNTPDKQFKPKRKFRP